MLALVADNPYLTVFVLAVAAAAFALTPLVLAALWAKFYSPNKPGLDKNATYECGLEAKGDAWVQFKSEYYLYAIIFLIFDVEAIFLVPFAVAFTGLPLRGVHRDPGLPPSPLGRTGLGLGQRVFKLGEVMAQQIDEGLRSELQKQGIWVTSIQELYNWGRRNSIWPLLQRRTGLLGYRAMASSFSSTMPTDGRGERRTSVEAGLSSLQQRQRR